MDSPTYPQVLAALSPADAARVERSVMRMRISGGVGCGPGVGSWLSSAVRSIVQPIANLAAPGTAATTAINTLFPTAQAAAAQQAPAAPAPNYTPVIVGSSLVLGAFLLSKKR